MNVKELNDFMQKPSVSSHFGQMSKTLAGYLTMVDSILGAFPEMDVKLRRDIFAEDVYAEAKEKVLGIDQTTTATKETE